MSSKMKHHNPQQESRYKSDLGERWSTQKGLSTVVFIAVVTLLSCFNPLASVFLPRVSLTDDAIVIDFAGVGNVPSNQGKSWTDPIAEHGFVPLPSPNPYPMRVRRQQQQQQQPYGWYYSFGYPRPIALEDVLPVRQVEGATTTTTPAIQCGKGPTALPARSSIGGRVVGPGVSVPKANAWPFLVTLRKYSDTTSTFPYFAVNHVDFCSGTLISDSKVLLAASCLEKMSLFEMSTVTVLIGITSHGASFVTDVQMTRRISKMVLHRQYNAFTYVNDIAILTLDSPVLLSRTVGPVCLPPTSTDPDQYVDQSAVIIGWGTSYTQYPMNILSHGTVVISSNSECKTDANFGKYVTDRNICINSADKFVCPGDVGGPVVVLSSPGIWTQIGINSYASSDCTKNSLQTRVSAFRTWIDQNMN